MLQALLQKLIKVGALSVRGPDGSLQTYGDGTGTPVVVRLNGRGARRIAMALDPGVGTCGKDGQAVPVGVGQPTIRIDSLTVGGTQA